MKKNGLLNSDISKVLADLGHTDQVILADCGLPVPEGVKKIDLALTKGVPSFEDVLHVLVQEMEIEKVILASEIQTKNEPLHQKVNALFKSSATAVQYISHEEFKKCSKKVKAVIRTGEATPFANVILQSGVIF